jgi:hypothetical protein
MEELPMLAGDLWVWATPPSMAGDHNRRVRPSYGRIELGKMALTDRKTSMTIKRRMPMIHKIAWFLSWVLVLGMARFVHAEDPTSRFLPLSPIGSSLPASSSGLAVQFEVWDQASGGAMIFLEAHSVDTDTVSNITNDTGRTDLLLGRGTAGGLLPANFPAGSTRYLDVTQAGVSVLKARIPFYAAVFSVSAPNEVPGNLTLVDSTAVAGNILKDGALFLHNFGTANTFLGRNSGNLTMTGAGNTANGESALSSITTGSRNTASGAGALRNNTAGIDNTASGYQALQSNTTGEENTANGSQALQSNSAGSYNTASGSQALQSNATGNFNTAVGFLALQSNTTGLSNTASGFLALYRNTVGQANTASGVTTLSANTTGSQNTGDGFNALDNNTTGIGNSALGFNALAANTAGFENTAIGEYADVSTGDLTNATAIGANARVDASNKIRLGSTTVTVIEGQVPYTFTSDRNQKENFRPVDGEQVLGKITGLNLTSWNYIGHDPQRFRHYGPVAQEFFAAFGRDGVGTVGTPTTINSGDMEGVLMIAVQALEKRTAELGGLKAENAELRGRVEKLERAIGFYVLEAHMNRWS